MIGLLIVAHGNLGKSLIDCAQHVMGGPLPFLQSLEVSQRDAPETLLPRGQALLRQLDQGAGVLVMSDIFGATPANIARRLLNPGQVEGVSGINLPMLIRAITYRDKTLPLLVEKALSGGIEGVIRMHGA